MATQSEINSVWAKRQSVIGHAPNNHLYGKDICGKLMYYHSFGMTSDMGWEIDHKNPISKGGSDSLVNKQPLHWENNRLKGNTYPWNCGK